MKKKAIMVVMNTLHTDARVQRAAIALCDLFELTVVGVNKDCGEQLFQQYILDISADNGVLRYYEYIRKVKHYLRTHEFDVFYSHDYFSAALATWVKNKYPRKIVIYDSHELIFPAEGFSTNRRDSFFRLFEKNAIKRADLVVCASSERCALMKKYYRMEKEALVIENISLLPIVDDEYSKNIKTNVDEALGINKYILVYAGALMAGRKIDRLISIVSKRMDTALLIIGDGPDRERLDSLAEKEIPGRYYFTGGLPYKYMGALLQNCDVGYISYPTDSLNNTFCAPNKVYEYASVNLPMIALDNPTIRNFFDEYSIGVINEDLGAAFDTVIENLEQYKNYCKLFTDTHQWSNKVTQLKDSIKSLF